MTPDPPPWRCAGASVIGTSHQLLGGRCEDAWSLSRGPADGPPVLAVCVCDGAGSVIRGAEGADAVSRAVAGWLATNSEPAFASADDRLRADLAAVARGTVRPLADAAGVPVDEFACTLVAVSVAADGRWVTVHLGDGGIVGQFGDEVRVVSPPRKGEFANQTYFVTDADAADQMRVARGPTADAPLPPRGFALFTDGVEGSVWDRRTGEVAPALREMFDWLRRHSEGAVAEAVRENLTAVFRPLTGDDCTLVLAADDAGPAGATPPDG